MTSEKNPSNISRQQMEFQFPWGFKRPALISSCTAIQSKNCFAEAMILRPCSRWSFFTGAPTPNIDKLAKAGMELKNLVVNSVCSPTRAAFLTGLNAVRNGFGAQVGGRLNREFKTVGNTFKDAGYRTAVFGKWHNGKPNLQIPHSVTRTQAGFKKFIGFYGGGIDFFSQTDKGSQTGSRN